MSLFFPTLATVPDFSRPPRRGTSTAHDRTGMGASRQIVFFPQRRADHLFDFRFALTTALEITTFKEFFRAQGGRCNPFYLPSWQRDLTAVGTAAAGTKLLEILSPDEDYSATHLEGTDADHYGRQLYFWKDGEVVHTDSILRVLPGTEAGQEILDLDNPLPFEVDADTWVGWAHLVRFTEDRLEWKHFSLRDAEVEVGFRGMRQANQNTTTQSIDQEDQYGQLGFTTCTLAPGEILPVTNRVAYAFGPENLHANQDDPYTEPWGVFPASDGVRLLRAVPPDDEVIWLPETDGTNSILFDSAIETDHIALAFDQNAYEVIAYQLTPETIECRRYFNGDTETVTWEGIDPILQFNGLLDQDLPSGDTDVVAYYLKPGDSVLYARFQRDNFATEYTAALLPGRPVALKRAYFEYNEGASAGVLQVEFVDAGLRVGVLSSAQYPDPPPPPIDPQVYARPDVDTASAGTGSLSGLYESAIIYADGGGEFAPHPPFVDGSEATFTVAGDYAETALSAPAEETATATFGATGSHVLSAFGPGVLDTDQSGASFSASGDYELIAIVPGISEEIAHATITTTGIYEPA